MEPVRYELEDLWRIAGAGPKPTGTMSFEEMNAAKARQEVVMLAADTNVWARALLEDDKAQSAKAKAALAQAQIGGMASSFR